MKRETRKKCQIDFVKIVCLERKYNTRLLVTTKTKLNKVKSEYIYLICISNTLVVSGKVL